MRKKEKTIDLDDLLDDQLDSTNSDMVIVAANQKRIPSEGEFNRLERLQKSAVIVDEPLFDGETELDMGTVKIGSPKDTQQIKKDLLNKHAEENAEAAKEVVEGMQGAEPEDVVSEFGLEEDSEVEKKRIERKEIDKVNSKAVQEILDDLLTRR